MSKKAKRNLRGKWLIAKLKYLRKIFPNSCITHTGRESSIRYSGMDEKLRDFAERLAKQIELGVITGQFPHPD